MAGEGQEGVAGIMNMIKIYCMSMKTMYTYCMLVEIFSKDMFAYLDLFLCISG